MHSAAYLHFSKKIILNHMPTNKNASFRYRVLNQCFTNPGRRRWTLDALIEEVSRHMLLEFGHDTTVGKRTIQGDLNLMRSPRPRGFGAPIVCRRGHYFYNDPSFSIESVPFDPRALESLREAFALLRQFKGLPQLQVLEELLMTVDGRQRVSPLSSTFIQFETNHHVVGLEWLSPLYEAIARRQVVRIQYHPFLEAPRAILLHPYLLKEWRNRWYVFGRNEEDRLWNLALDRIRAAAPAPEVAYRANDLFDPATWFNDIIGVTKPEGAQALDIELETSLLVSYYLETKPLHASQRLLERNAAAARFTLHLIPNQELLGELLHFGHELRVVGPALVKEMWLERRGSSLRSE